MDEFDVSTIGRRSVHGILALISRNFFLYLISFVASLIIFSILTQSEVGVYTAVLAIQRIISFFTDFGLGAALIQKKDKLTQEDLATSFTIQSSITFGIFILILFFQHAISSFFNLSDSADQLFVVLVFCIFLSSFKTIPSILLERDIKFHKLVIPQIVESLVFNILLIMLLLKGFKLYSFSWAFLISSLIGIPFYYIVSPWKISFAIDKNSLKHLKFGIQFQAKNILATLKDDFLTVFLTKVLTFSEIGYIGFGQKWAFFVYRFVVDSVTKVTFSSYARIQDDTERLRRAIEKSLFYVASLMFPILLGLIVTMPYIIQYLPGWHNKWEGALVVLTFFCLNALVSSLSGILVNVLDSTGRVKTTLKLMVVWTTLIWILTPLLILFFGYNGVAIASFLVTLTIFVTIYLVKKVVAFDFTGSIYKPTISSFIMIAIVYMISGFFIVNLVTLLFTICLGGLIYIIAMFILAKKEISEGIKLITSKI